MSELEHQITSKEPKGFDAGDPIHVKKRRKEAKQQEIARIDALMAFMSHPQGRAYIWWLLGQCGVHRTSFTGDPYRTVFNEGQRNIGLMVFAELHKHCAGDYAKMVNEAQDIGD